MSPLWTWLGQKTQDILRRMANFKKSPISPPILQQRHCYATKLLVVFATLLLVASGSQARKQSTPPDAEDYAVVEAGKLTAEESADRKDPSLKPEDLATRSEAREERAKELLAAHPQSARLHDSVAGIDYSAGRFEQGLARSGQAIALAEQKSDKKALVSALVNRGEKGYIAMGDYPRAYADAAKALEHFLKNQIGRAHV